MADLLSRMSQAELCGQLGDRMAPIAKVPSWAGYNWNTECLHGLGAQCLTVDNVTRCPSVFPAPPAVRPISCRTISCADLGLSDRADQ